MKEHKALIFILAATFLVYFKTCFFGFVDFDDGLYIFMNNKVINFDLEKAWLFLSNLESGHYHPVNMISYGLQSKIHGLQGEYFHAFNLIFHLLASVVVYFFTLNLGKDKALAIFVTAFFALHPIQVEAVTWVGTRGTLLSGFFSLLSLHFYVQYLEKKLAVKQLSISVLCLLLAVGSKSSAIILPIVFFGIDILKKRKINLNTVLEKIPFLVISLAFGIVAILAARELGTVSESSLGDTKGSSALNRMAFILYSVSFYFNKFFIPNGFTAMHYDPKLVDGMYTLRFYLAPIPMLLAIPLSIKLCKWNKLLLFGWFFYFVSYSLVINIIPLGGTIVSERYAYVANIGLYLVVFQCFDLLISKIKYKQILLTIWIGILAIVSFMRIDVWKDSISLYGDMHEKNPNFAHALGGLGSSHLIKGNYQESLEYLNQALELERTHNLLLKRATVYSLLDSNEKAMQDINESLMYSSDLDRVYFSRAVVKKAEGDFEGALKDYNLAIRFNPDLAHLWFERGVFKYSFGDGSGACSDWEKATSLNHDIAPQFLNKACLSQKAKNKDLKLKTEYLKQIKYPNGKVEFEIVKENKQLFLNQYDTLGNIKERGAVNASGKYDGKVLWYYPNGQLQREGFYRDIFPYGEWKEYYENGNLLATYAFDKGSKAGKEEYFHENGTAWVSREYKNGKLFHVDFIRNNSGENLEIGDFKEGSGILNVYDEEGNITSKAHYDKGTLKFLEKL